MYGDAGSRKTTAILQLAKRFKDTEFRVVECDWSPSIDVFRANPLYAGLDNLLTRVAYPDEYDSQLEGMLWATAAGKGNWGVFDSFTHTWEASQEKYIEEQFDKEADAFYMQKRGEQIANDKRGGGLDGQMDWPLIKKWHNRFYKAVMKSQAHFILTMEQTTVNQEHLNGAREEMGLFGRERYMPRGRKQIAHVPRTILHLEVDRDGTASYSSMKDRDRELQTDHTWTDFGRDYLMSVGGWTYVNPKPTEPAATSPEIPTTTTHTMADPAER